MDHFVWTYIFFISFYVFLPAGFFAIQKIKRIFVSMGFEMIRDVIISRLRADEMPLLYLIYLKMIIVGRSVIINKTVFLFSEVESIYLFCINGFYKSDFILI